MSGAEKSGDLYSFEELQRNITDTSTPLGKLFKKLATPTGWVGYRTATYDNMLTKTEKAEYEKFVASYNALEDADKKGVIDNLGISGDTLLGRVRARTTPVKTIVTEYEKYVRGPKIKAKRRAAKIKARTALMSGLDLFTQKEMLDGLAEPKSDIAKLFKKLATSGVIGGRTSASGGLAVKDIKLFTKFLNSQAALLDTEERKPIHEFALKGAGILTEESIGAKFGSSTKLLKVMNEYLDTAEYRKYAADQIADSKADIWYYTKRKPIKKEDLAVLLQQKKGAPEQNSPEFKVLEKLATANSYASAGLTPEENKIFANILASYTTLEDSTAVDNIKIGGGTFSAYKAGQLIDGYKKSAAFGKAAAQMSKNVGQKKLEEKIREVAAEKKADKAKRKAASVEGSYIDDGASVASGTSLYTGTSGVHEASAKVDPLAHTLALKLASSAPTRDAGTVAAVKGGSGMRAAALADRLQDAADHLKKRGARTSPAAGSGGTVDAAGAKAASSAVDAAINDIVLAEALEHYRKVDLDKPPKLDAAMTAKYGDKKLNMTFSDRKDYESFIKTQLNNVVLPEGTDETDRKVLEERRHRINKAVHSLVDGHSRELVARGNQESITFDGAKVIATMSATGEVESIDAVPLAGKAPEKHLTVTFPREDRSGRIVGHDVICFKYNETSSKYELSNSRVLNEGKGKLSHALLSKLSKDIDGVELKPRAVSGMAAATRIGKKMKVAGASSVSDARPVSHFPSAGGSKAAGRGSGRGKSSK